MSFMSSRSSTAPLSQVAIISRFPTGRLAPGALDPILNLQDRKMCAEQMYRAWAPMLGLSREENDRAIDTGFEALEDCENDMRRQAREPLDQLEREDRIGIVMLGSVYHHHPGLNREIMEEFQNSATRSSHKARSHWTKTCWNAYSAMKCAPV
jgi:hypothetical protein